ncbi:TonB-dependent receptor [Thalassotalea sp. G2M2-11]|uniref:TonB-dependent receptor domain-containing protein n=1 Tax=Thalassotalea sp. G2M2-11 TaxID=2787627 RepID=UPI0019D08DBD|nr:TonB-dependent receptor [Thalassotalea sp. G2M2-11]
MKKALLTSAILSALTLPTTFVFANSANVHHDETLVDEHILVTANRTQQDSYLALSSNNIITQEDIEQLQVTSVGDILSTLAGIHVTNQGGAGQKSSVFTRGTNSNHTLVLVDGIRVGSATLGAVSLSSMSAEQIERIEVIKGPRAALWGSDAIGGVIQIFTKRYANNEGAVSLGIGSHSLYSGAFSYGFGNEQHQYTLNVSSEKSDGFNAYLSDPNNPYDINEPDDDGYQRQAVSLIGLSQFTKQFALNVAGKFEQSDSDYDASYPDAPCWDDASKVCPNYYANQQQSDNYHIKVAGQYHSENAWLELAVAKSEDQAATYGNGIKKGNADTIETEREQVSLVGHYQLNAQTGVTLGSDWYQEKVSTDTDKVSWLPGFQAWDVDQRTVKAVFIQARHQVEQFLLEAATRYDDIENLDSEVTYNASLGYQLSDDWLISLNCGSAFKAPTFNDLYWPGSGNPELAPENSTTHELLVRHKKQNSLVELSVYDTEVDNLIAWSPNEFGQWQPDNINQATIQGADLNISATIAEFDHQLALAYVDAEDKATGKALLRRPKTLANYSVYYNWQDWQFGTQVSYYGSSKDSGDTKLDSYWLVDLTASYQVNQQLKVAAKVVNAFDEDYQSALNYQTDDTSYRVKVTYTF